MAGRGRPTARRSRITDSVVLGPDAVAGQLTYFALGQLFSVRQAQRALGTTRRVAVPLVERLNSDGATVQRPDGTHTFS